MTQEEKVMFLMRLAVDSYNANFSEHPNPLDRIPSATEASGAISVIYDALETFLDRKLSSVTDGTSSKQ
ncbi:TPA: hypothetical protein RXO57_000406 [Escherichia coli]|uniref:hypothetical protein n=1 Tax=Escherichia coli TaxID=562 RepID=UPI00053B7EAF|nr:hypothetical protein [Escherichia coli]HBC2971107.1 hypothetical protein [Escherichia coli O146]EED0624385.1 hypothetical protein [Escherichia coli]EET5596561.1 hypothetical protein [Escherichia coli]EET8459513.1 hypothetical protein [Escherichia coli]EEU2709885.1 hypothetical protein [Escherichia coli]